MKHREPLPLPLWRPELCSCCRGPLERFEGQSYCPDCCRVELGAERLPPLTLACRFSSAKGGDGSVDGRPHE